METASAAAEIRYVPADGISAHYGVLVYYAVLAYPGRSEWPKRERFVRAAKAMLLKQYIALGGHRKMIFPSYRRFKNEKIQGILNQGFRRIG